jgi:hypothetical protein
MRRGTCPVAAARLAKNGMRRGSVIGRLGRPPGAATRVTTVTRFTGDTPSRIPARGAVAAYRRCPWGGAA